MHFGFVCPPLRGHLNPTLALASILNERGHESTCFGPSDIEAVVNASGVNFYCVGRNSHPVGDSERRAREMARASSLWGMLNVIATMARDTDMFAQELPAAFEAVGIDAVITDQLEPAGALVALKLGLPYVSLANALPINRDPIVPPFFTGWKPARSTWDRQSIKGAEDVYDLIMHRHAQVISRFARQWGLGSGSRCADFLSPLADIAPITEEFDFPRENRPANLHYVGPIRFDSRRNRSDSAPSEPDRIEKFRIRQDRPLVFASFGTLLGGKFDLFHTLAKACDRLGAQLIIAHGGRLSSRQIETLSNYAHVETYVDQRKMLQKAALCITHGGMNTTMDAMEFGVPALAIPMAFDQKAIAARLEWHGCGQRIPPSRLTVNKAQRAIGELLGNPRYRENAKRISASIAASGGGEKAADIILSAVRADRQARVPDFAS